jgi:2,3-bisphosphoglycerate-independent phosphoglycerate mutase
LTPSRTAPQRSGPVARLLIVLDGLADQTPSADDGPTPLEAAATPYLDGLAARGRLGTLSILGPGIAPESDAGVLALLGYDPEHDSPGRGVLEALGAEVPLARGEIALRLNFATLGEGRTVDDPRVGRTLKTEEARELAEAITAADLLHDLGVRAEVRATVGHRGVLWLRPDPSSPLSPEISNADPFYVKVGGLGHARRPAHPAVETVRALDGAPESVRAAEAVNRFLERVPRVLEEHRVNRSRKARGDKVANGLLVRDAGGVPRADYPLFADRWGEAGAALTEMPVERGIARVLGIEDRFVGPLGAEREAGYRERASAARALLEAFPFVYVHLKGPDEPGHDGDVAKKRSVIEAIDRSFFGPLLDGLDLARLRLAVTADHATPCARKGHSDDPVPLLLAGAGIEAAPVPPPGKFCERAAARGPLGARRGAELMPLLFGREPRLPRR